MKFRRIILFGLVVLLVYVEWRGMRDGSENKPMMINQEVPQFDVYYPETANNTLVVLMHGGSWMVGDRDQLYGLGHYLAEQGMTVVNIEYRLAPNWTYPAPLEDMALVIKKVESELNTYRLTPDYRLVLLGFSAGGHLVSQFGLTESEYGIKQAEACISLAGIYDLERIEKNQDGPLLKDAVKVFLGRARAREASPKFQIEKNEPTRFLLIRGMADQVVSTMQMVEFEQALRNKGALVETTIIPERDHLGIFSTFSLGDEVAQKVLRFLEK